MHSYGSIKMVSLASASFSSSSPATTTTTTGTSSSSCSSSLWMSDNDSNSNSSSCSSRRRTDSDGDGDSERTFVSKLNGAVRTDPEEEEEEDDIDSSTRKSKDCCLCLSSGSDGGGGGRSLLHLPPELWILVLNWLTLPETRLMMQVHSQFRNWLHSEIRPRPLSDKDREDDDDDDDPLDDIHNHNVDAVKPPSPLDQYHDSPPTGGGVAVWNEHAHRLWPSLLTVNNNNNNNDSNHSQSMMQFTHSASQLLAIAQPVPCVMMGVVDHHYYSSNDNRDASSSTTTTTTTTPPSLSNPPLSQRTLSRRRRPLMVVHSLPRNPKEEKKKKNDGSGSNNNHSPPGTNQTYYQYTGPVGQGDRCIRAKVPLPHVTWTLSKKRKEADRFSWQDLDDDDQDEEHGDVAWNSSRGHYRHYSRSHHQSLFQRFGLRSCTQALAAALSTPPLTWRPFCTPLQHEDGSLVLAPRVVSYFEVSIRDPPPEDVDDYYDDYSSSRIWAPRATTTSSTTTTTDCIAVGICTRFFLWKARMPGWDNHSIGYHSDDGGLFFGSGSMQRRYGPQFGPGDTIGCALDHVRRVVFFTRNGRSLGPAVQLARPVVPSSRHADRLFSSSSSPPPPSVVPPAEEWYPVVGLDSNALVHCNFSGPFVFDLDRYEHERYEETMEQAMKVPPPMVSV